jgi:hypothetical protein
MDHYQAWTNENGEFSIEEVEVGDYEAHAMLTGYGYDQQDVQIVMNQNTEVNFVLGFQGGHHGGHWGYEFEEVTLHGWTIVEEGHMMMMDYYFLDEDNDGVPEYQLGFGPPWYEPSSGAQRPQNGDEIDVVGGMIDMMMDLPMVMVWELNGETWMEPDSLGHHGGNGGGWHVGHGCDFEDPTMINAQGWAMMDNQATVHDQYWMDEDGDTNPEFRLSFGDLSYTPGNGAERPQTDDWVEVTGGLIEGCPEAPTIVVYEINGRFWREPGDTTGLGSYTLAVGDLEHPPTTPISHLLVDAYPNPFNPTTQILFSVPSDGLVLVKVYDVLGRQVSILQDGFLPSGNYSRTLDASDWTSGLYFVRIEANNSTAYTRIALIK